MDDAEYSVVAQVLENELDWLSQIIDRVIHNYNKTGYYKTGEDRNRTHQGNDNPSIESIKENHFPDITTNYTRFVIENNLSFYERLLLVLTLAPHLRPECLNKRLRQDNLNKMHPTGLRELPENNIFIPTGLTFLFLVNNRTYGKPALAKFLFGTSFLAPESKLFKQKVISLETPTLGNVFFSGKLIMSRSYFQLFINPVMHENKYKEERA